MSARISARREARSARRGVADPLRLELGERHHRAERLQQPDEEERRGRRGGTRAGTAADRCRARRSGRVEERERDLVARAVDDDVGLLLGAVGEAHACARQLRDVRLRRDLAVREAREASSRRSGAPRRSGGRAWAARSAPCRPPSSRSTRARSAGGRAKAPARAAASVSSGRPNRTSGSRGRRGGRRGRCGGRERGLDRDVHRRVAHAEHDHRPVAEQRRVVAGVLVRVHLTPAKRRARGTRGRATADPSGGRWRRSARRRARPAACGA